VREERKRKKQGCGKFTCHILVFNTPDRGTVDRKEGNIYYPHSASSNQKTHKKHSFSLKN
jgi:hypothetical protein